jgi:hypothetical protein
MGKKEISWFEWHGDKRRAFEWSLFDVGEKETLLWLGSHSTPIVVFERRLLV